MSLQSGGSGNAMPSGIPVVNLGPLNLSAHDVTRDVIMTWSSHDPVVEKLSAEIVAAFTQIGFVYLTNHGVPHSTVDKANEVTNTLFTSPLETKSKYSRQWPGNSNGWIGLQKERLDPEKPADYKEAYNILPLSAQGWPDTDVPGFKDAMLSMHSQCVRLTQVVLMLMGIGLKLQEPDFFVRTHNIDTEPSYTTLRSLFYPALPKDIVLSPGAVRCGEHSDFGSITLLFQDDAGGLEVKHRDGHFVPAVPVPGSVLVNVADAMQRWTADRLISTRHRVLIPEDEARSHKVRRSMAFFVHSDDNAMIACIDGSNKYLPILSSDYTDMRLIGAQKLS